MNQLKKSLFVCVGDISADRHAGKLVSRLKQVCPGLDIWGVGGACMEAAGVRLLYNCESLAVIGLVEVVRYLPKLLLMRNELVKKIGKEKPDALLLMDFGGFNLGFAKLIRKHLKDVPIIYFISPQVWGSRPWRIKAIARAITKMLVIFPFEEALYKSKGIDASFVGHPLATKTRQVKQDKESFFQEQGLDSKKPLIAVFPGSRRQEITSHSAVVLQAIAWLKQERPELQFLISVTNQALADVFYEEVYRLGYGNLFGKDIKTIPSAHNEELFNHADICWTKSGTITLEAALAGKPMLIFYRGNWLSTLMVLIFKTIKYVGWPNLLAGSALVPELLQLDCRSESFVKYTRDWLDVPGRCQEIGLKLKALRACLGEGDFTCAAAREILNILDLEEVNLNTSIYGAGHKIATEH